MIIIFVNLLWITIYEFVSRFWGVFLIKNFSYFVLRTKYRTGYRCAPGYHSNSERSCSYGMYIHLVSFTYYNMPVFVSKKKKRKNMQMNTRPNFYFEIRESTSNLTYKTFKLATPTYQKKHPYIISPPQKKNIIFSFIQYLRVTLIQK